MTSAKDDQMYDVLRPGHECQPDGRMDHKDGAVIACRQCGAVYRARTKKYDFGVTWSRQGLITRWWLRRAWRRETIREPEDTKFTYVGVDTYFAPTATANGPGATANANVTISKGTPR